MGALFEQIKAEYRSICDHYWKADNEEVLQQLEEKRETLQGWAKIINNKKEKVQAFEEEYILENNRLETEEDPY